MASWQSDAGDASRLQFDPFARPGDCTSGLFYGRSMVCCTPLSTVQDMRLAPVHCSCHGKAMPIDLIIARYGLAAVCLGAGIEGETAVMAGGVLAHQDLVSLPGAALAAAVGSFVADQAFFSIGRRFRDRTYVRNVLAKPAAERAITLLERHPDRFILAIRFLYGIRTLSPIAVGTSGVSRTRFMALNAVAAIVWAVLFTAIGFELGGGLKSLLRRAHSFAPALIGLIVVVGGALVVVRLICRRLHHRAGATDKGFVGSRA